MTLTTLSDRAVVRLSGDDVQAFLQSLVTNDVAGDGAVYAALLTPQGKVLFDFFVETEARMGQKHMELTGDYLIDCEATRADALVKRLVLYRLRRDITIAVDPDLCVWWTMDWHDGWPDARFFSNQACSHWMGNRGISAKRADDVDASAAYRAHRLSLGVTEGVAELGDGTTLWLECNAAELNGVSFTKGCYVGQENTARMNWRSTVNRRLVVVPLVDADLSRQRIAYPALGWSVEHRRIDDIPDAAWRTWMGPRS